MKTLAATSHNNVFFPYRIQSVQPGQTQQYFIKHPKYYHTHTTHTQTHLQPQPERPIPLTAGHNPIHGEYGETHGDEIHQDHLFKMLLSRQTQRGCSSVWAMPPCIICQTVPSNSYWVMQRLACKNTKKTNLQWICIAWDVLVRPRDAIGQLV